MKINKLNVAFLGALTISALAFELSAKAADEMGNRDNLEKFEKNIAKDKDDVSKKISEIKTQKSKIEKDTAQYGQSSNEVKGDQDKLKDLRKDLVDPKVDLYKNSIQRKVESGEALEDEAGCE